MPRVAVSGRVALSWSRSILPDNRGTAIATSSPNNVTIGAAVADPFGGTEARKISSSVAGFAQHNIYMGIGLGFASAGSMGWIASSCFFRYLGEARYAFIEWPGTAGYTAVFDLMNETVASLVQRGTISLTTETMHQASASITKQDLPDNWMRCTLATFVNGFSSNTFLGTYGVSSANASASVLAVGQGAEVCYPMIAKANWGSVPAINSIANPGALRNKVSGRVAVSGRVVP